MAPKLRLACGCESFRVFCFKLLPPGLRGSQCGCIGCGLSLTILVVALTEISDQHVTDQGDDKNSCDGVREHRSLLVGHDVV